MYDQHFWSASILLWGKFHKLPPRHFQRCVTLTLGLSLFTQWLHCREGAQNTRKWAKKASEKPCLQPHTCQYYKLHVPTWQNYPRTIKLLSSHAYLWALRAIGDQAHNHSWPPAPNGPQKPATLNNSLVRRLFSRTALPSLPHSSETLGHYLSFHQENRSYWGELQ